MTILVRYIIKEIAKHFGIIFVVVMGIYLAVDFIEKIDNFVEVNVPLSRALLYFAYKLPLILVQITPVGVLLAVLITFGLMGKNNELVALRSCGISLASLARPIFLCGVTGTLLVILTAEGVAPLTMVRANKIWLQEVKGHRMTTTRQKDIWLKGEQSIIHLKFYQPDSKSAMGISVNRFDRQFNLVQRIDARQGVFMEGRWLLKDGIVQQREGAKEAWQVSLFDAQQVDLPFTLDDLAKAAPQTEEMSFLQLYRYVEKVRADGYDAVRYQVDLQAKISFPFVCIIMTLIGAGLAARGKIRDGLAVSIIYGLGIIFLYAIAFFLLFMRLGYAGILPPVLAAWGVNVLFLCLAGYLFVNAD
ncbi:MAG: LPS export ABC transporter permease LptG [Desulfatitalea sp.]